MATRGAAHVEHVVRSSPIIQVIEDRWSDNSSVYIGKTPLFTTATTEAKWQIERQTFDGSRIITEFANHGKWCNVWDDRATYFGPPGGVNFPGDVTISGSITGEFTPVGLTKAGKFRKVTLNDTTWTAVPATPLTNRNTIKFLNRTPFEVYINFAPTEPIYDGMLVTPNDGTLSYPVRDTIVLYAMFELGGSGNLHVEELA